MEYLVPFPYKPTGFDRICHRHLHLHIVASDLFSDRLKHKKHYNSFHPKLGFFLHLDDVLSWFDATPSYYDTVRAHAHFCWRPSAL